MRGMIYVISGPSGAGKSTIIRSVRDHFPELGYSVSHTSRTPRVNEQNGVDYHFVDSISFEKMIENNDFVEWARVYDACYGTSRKGLETITDSGSDVLLDIDSQGAANIKKSFTNTLLIYIMPPSLEDLKKRLAFRATDREEVIRKRTARAEQELKNCEWYDYIVINDILENAIDQVRAIITADHSRKERVIHKIKDKFEILSSLKP